MERSSLRRRLALAWRNLTVEPLLTCYLLPSALTALAVENLNLEKACRVNLRYNSTVCDALTAREVDAFRDEDNEAQRLVAQVAVWRNALRASLPALLALFAGSWSDRRARRKPLLLAPLAGELVACVGLLLCTRFFLEWPLEVAGVVQGLFPALSGGTTVVVMAVFSYVADVTSEEERTFRMGVVNVCVFLCVPLGTALGGVLFKPLGFYGMFSLAAAFYALGLVYGTLFLQEARPPVPRPPTVGFARDLFDPRHVVETFSVASKRPRVLPVVVLFVLVLGPSFGEAVVAYLFMRNRFNWDEVQASYFATYSELVNFVGTVVVVALFAKVFKMQDAIIGVTSCVSKILASFVYAFSFTVWMFYMGPLVDLLGGATLISVRSIASKLVPADDLGKVNSLFGVCESFAPFVYGPLFSVIYAKTLDTMSGAFFLCAAALTAPAILFFGWMYILQKKEVAEKYVAPSRVEPEASVVTASWD